MLPSESSAWWVKGQIYSKEYSSVSDAVKNLISQARRNEVEKIENIRAMLVEAENSVNQHGYSQKTVHEIWETAKQKYKAKHGDV